MNAPEPRDVIERCIEWLEREAGDHEEWPQDRAWAKYLRGVLGRHDCSDVGNAFGGYDCKCGEPWSSGAGSLPAGCVELRAAAALARRLMGEADE